METYAVELTPYVKSLKSVLFTLILEERFPGYSLAQIEKHFSRDKYTTDADFWANSPFTLKRYRNGKGIRNSHVVKNIKAELPGMERFLNHPLWDILRNPFASQLEINSYLRRLHPEIVSDLFRTDPINAEMVRKPIKYSTQLDKIVLRGDLDALACMLILTREMELERRPHTYVLLKWEIRYAFYLLSSWVPLMRMGPTFYDLCYVAFIARNDPLPDEFETNWPKDHDCFRCPEENGWFIMASHQINSSILWHAHYHKLIPDHKKTNQRFLFFANSKHSNRKVKEALKALPGDYFYDGDSDSLPSELYSLMEEYNEDWRTMKMDNYLYDFRHVKQKKTKINKLF